MFDTIGSERPIQRIHNRFKFRHFNRIEFCVGLVDVDNLMTNALTLGAQTEKKVIDTEVILVSIKSWNLG